MMSFKDYLTESRSAPLYHGTGSEQLYNILRTNTIKPSVDILGATPVISLTRSLRFAKSWADYNHSESYVIELNQERLIQRYRVKPFNFFSNKTRYIGDTEVNDLEGSNEYEERIVGREIKDVDKYITKIIAFKKPGRIFGPMGELILKHPKLYYNGKFINR